MHAAVISRWQRPARGREGKALEVFTQFGDFWSQRAADDKSSERQVFLSADGDGFSMVTGDREALEEICRSEEYRTLLAMAHFCVDGLETRIFATGESVDAEIGLWVNGGQELGFL